MHIMFLCMFKPFSDANRGLNWKLCILYYVKAGGRDPNSAATTTRRPAQAPGYRSDPRKSFSFFVFVSVMMRTDGSAIGCPPPQALVPWSPRRQQIRGAARHGTTSRSRVHWESSLSLSLHVSSWHCRARPGFSWYGDWHASAWPVPVVCTWAHINSVPNMDGDARPLPSSPIHLAVAPCMPSVEGTSCPV